MSKKVAPENKKLTTKQEAWCLEYIKNGYNATQAAKDAGYKGSYATLKVVGSENLAKPNLKKRISQHFEDQAMGANEVLERLGAMARSFDMTKYIELKEQNKITTKVVNGKQKHYKEFTGYVVSFDLEKLQEDGFSHLVKKIKQTNQGSIEIEWHDQKHALELIGKHHKLFTEKIELEGSLDLIGISDDGLIAGATAIIAHRQKNTSEGN